MIREDEEVDIENDWKVEEIENDLRERREVRDKSDWGERGEVIDNDWLERGGGYRK